jgi:hypothetical protein
MPKKALVLAAALLVTTLGAQLSPRAEAAGRPIKNAAALPAAGTRAEPARDVRTLAPAAAPAATRPEPARDVTTP